MWVYFTNVYSQSPLTLSTPNLKYRTHFALFQVEQATQQRRRQAVEWSKSFRTPKHTARRCSSELTRLTELTTLTSAVLLSSFCLYCFPLLSCWGWLSLVDTWTSCTPVSATDGCKVCLWLVVTCWFDGMPPCWRVGKLSLGG